MHYVEGFVIPVPAEKRDEFVETARQFDTLIMAEGALRIVECWQDDVPPGKQTDMFRAVDAAEGEVVAFSWIEWPDKPTRDAAHARMQERMKTDPLFDAEKNPPPFDGKRMIFGGFVPVLILGDK